MNQIGRYTLKELLGQGGAGEVYRGVLSGPGGFRRDVAVKMLIENVLSLEREARLGGLLRHQHLVDVYEIGESNGRWFCAMELCKGGALTQHLPLPPRAVIEVGLQICDALQYAHEELGLVHRDLKPSNLLLSDGVVKVADLGIARANGFNARQGISGTPGFMAPEQLRGWRQDARTDIYALGVTLITLSTGEFPRSSTLPIGAPGSQTHQVRDSDETLNLDDLDTNSATLRHDEPKSLPPLDIHETWEDGPAPTGDHAASSTFQRAAPEAPSWLSAVIERCLAPKPGDRWQSMQELAEALRAVEVSGLGLRAHIGWEPPTQPARDPHSNLGPESDAFVGRRAALKSLRSALSEGGLIAVSGPVGVGKSRLAAAAARAWREETGAPAWRCDLSQVRDAGGLLSAVAGPLEIPLLRGDEGQLFETVGHALASRGAAILILDDCDHLVPQLELALQWPTLAPQLRLLLTSRQALSLEGAAQLSLSPLARDAALSLLIERARDRGVELERTPELDALAEQLDDLPLALELAAGRLGVLSVRDLLEHFRPSMLRRGTSDRHGTLRAAFEWSWSLLSPVERSVLSQLSVFSGCTLEAAEGVVELSTSEGEERASLFDVIQSLLDRSLLRFDTTRDQTTPGEPRLQIYNSLQLYIQEELNDAGAAAIRHGEWFAARCLCVDRLDGQDFDALGTWRSRAELDNLILACERALGRGDADCAVATSHGVMNMLRLQGPYYVAYELLKRTENVAEQSSPAFRAWLHYNLAVITLRMGNTDVSLAYADEALNLWRSAGALVLGSRAMLLLGVLYFERGDYGRSRAYYEDALAILRAQGRGVAMARLMSNMGSLYRQLEERELALSHYRQAIQIHREFGNSRGVGIAFQGLGNLYLQLEREDDALECFEEAMPRLRESGDRRSMAALLVQRSHIEIDRGRWARAAEMLTEAQRLHREIGHRRGQALALSNLGLMRLRQLQIDASITHYREALAIFYDINARDRIGVTLTNLGYAYTIQGDQERAAEAYLKSLQLQRALGRKRSEGIALRGLGQLRREQGRRAEAREFLQSALTIFQALRISTQELHVQGELGALRFDAGERDAGLEQLSHAIEELREISSASGLLHLLLLRPPRALEIGRRDLAREDLETLRALNTFIQGPVDGPLAIQITALETTLARDRQTPAPHLS